jgi:DNA repair exonuclease SbcCD ATPase subunit
MNDDIETIRDALKHSYDWNEPRTQKGLAACDRLEAELTRLRAEKRRWIVDGGHDGSCLEVKAAALAEIERLREKLRSMWRKITRLRRIEEAAKRLSDRVLGMTSVVYVPLREEAEALRNALAEEVTPIQTDP